MKWFTGVKPIARNMESQMRKLMAPKALKICYDKTHRKYVICRPCAYKLLFPKAAAKPKAVNRVKKAVAKAGEAAAAMA